jgi:hypothetical protein
MQLTHSFASDSDSLLDGLTGMIALLVDPDLHLFSTSKVILSGLSYSVFSACSFGDVFDLQPQREPHIAVLSEKLGPAQLPAVAVYIRRRWPRTRILVVGRASSLLEDQLYDENVAGGCNPAEFRAAVERCSHPPMSRIHLAARPSGMAWRVA